jgi:hypothetical protein
MYKKVVNLKFCVKLFSKSAYVSTGFKKYTESKLITKFKSCTLFEHQITTETWVEQNTDSATTV